MYSNCCCSCSFEREIRKIGQSSQKMYRNNILNSQESTTILNSFTKKSVNLLKAPHIFKLGFSTTLRYDIPNETGRLVFSLRLFSYIKTGCSKKMRQISVLHETDHRVWGAILSYTHVYIHKSPH